MDVHLRISLDGSYASWFGAGRYLLLDHLLDSMLRHPWVLETLLVQQVQKVRWLLLIWVISVALNVHVWRKCRTTFTWHFNQHLLITLLWFLILRRRVHSQRLWLLCSNSSLSYYLGVIKVWIYWTFALH